MKIFLLLLIAINCLAQDKEYEAELQNQFYIELNIIRAEHNISPLEVDHNLEKKSKQWLKKMHKNYLGLAHEHDGNAEVLARGYDCLKQWLNSPAHRKIILDRRYKKIGVAFNINDSCAKLY